MARIKQAAPKSVRGKFAREQLAVEPVPKPRHHGPDNSVSCDAGEDLLIQKLFQRLVHDIVGYIQSDISFQRLAILILLDATEAYLRDID